MSPVVKVQKRIDPKQGAQIAAAGALAGMAAVAGLVWYGLKQAGRDVIGTFMGDRPGQGG